MEISPPSNLLGNSPSSSLSGFGLQRFTLSSVSRLQTERRASLFWLEGRAKEHALKAYDSLDKHTPRRHPKLIIGYRLASRVLSVCRVVVLRDRFATDGRSCRPLCGGSRREAMRSDAFPFLTVNIIPKIKELGRLGRGVFPRGGGSTLTKCLTTPPDGFKAQANPAYGHWWCRPASYPQS